MGTEETKSKHSIEEKTVIIPSITESRLIILDNALTRAKKILEDRSLLFQITDEKQKADEIITTQVDTFIEKEDIEGIAASLLQNYRFFGDETLSSKLALKIGKLLLEKADLYYFDEALNEKALICYQLATGLNPQSVDALRGVQAVCLHCEPSQVKMALPYAVITLYLEQKQNSVGDIIKKMNVSETYNPVHALERYENEEQQSNSDWLFAGYNMLRTGIISKEITTPPALCWTFKKCIRIQEGMVSSHSIAVCRDHEGALYGIRLRDGKRLWKRSMGKFYAGTPVIHGEFVFAGSSYGARCLHLTSGKKRWETDRKIKKYLPGGDSGCAFYKGDFVFFCDNNLTIYNADNGNIEGEFETRFEAHNHTGACSRGEYIYIPAYCSIIVLSLYTGAIIEKIYIDGKITAGPLIADNLIIVGTDRPTIDAFSLHDRNRSWRYRIENTAKPLTSRPVYGNGKVFFCAPDGIVYALDAKDGKELWRFVTGSQIESSPAGCKNGILTLSTNGTLFLLSEEDGTILWQYKHPGTASLSASCSPVLAGGYLLTGWNGLHAFSLK
jgi:outer membrane protein assembly factor BamB